MSKLVKMLPGPSALLSLLGGGSKEREPVIKPPAPMADPEDPLLRTAQRKKAAKRGGVSGRSSTILSGSGTGTGSFTNTQL